MLSIMLHICVLHFFPQKTSLLYILFLDPFWKAVHGSQQGFCFKIYARLWTCLENGDILHSWWHPEIRYIHQLRVVGSWNPIFTWFLAPSQLVYLMIYGALAPIPGSLSHYLQGFSTIQTVVGNGISEPSTSNVPIGSMHGMNLPTWIVDNWIGC